MIRNCFRQSMASSLKIGYPRIQLKVDHHFSTWKVVIIIPDSPLLMGYRLQQVTLEVIWVPWWWSHCQHWGDSGSAVPRPFPGSFFGGKNLWETLALMGKTYGKPTGFSMFFPFIKGEHLSETRRCFFVSAFFPMLIRVFLCPFIQGRLHQQEPGRGNASRWLWNSEFDDAPKISQNDGQVQPGSLVKHWWGRDHRGFWHAQSMQRSDLRLPRCSSNLAHTQIRLLIEATFHFSGGLPWLPWLPTLCGPLLDDNLCTLRGCENVRQQTPGGAGLKWG